MFWKDHQCLIMPPDVAQYHSVKAGLVRTISFFNNTQNLEGYYKDMGSSFDWYVPMSIPKKGYVSLLMDVPYLSMNVCSPRWDLSSSSIVSSNGCWITWELTCLNYTWYLGPLSKYSNIFVSTEERCRPWVYSSISSIWHAFWPVKIRDKGCSKFVSRCIYLMFT